MKVQQVNYQTNSQKNAFGASLEGTAEIARLGREFGNIIDELAVHVAPIKLPNKNPLGIVLSSMPQSNNLDVIVREYGRPYMQNFVETPVKTDAKPEELLNLIKNAIDAGLKKLTSKSK